MKISNNYIFSIWAETVFHLKFSSSSFKKCCARECIKWKLLKFVRHCTTRLVCNNLTINICCYKLVFNQEWINFRTPSESDLQVLCSHTDLQMIEFCRYLCKLMCFFAKCLPNVVLQLRTIALVSGQNYQDNYKFDRIWIPCTRYHMRMSWWANKSILP